MAQRARGDRERCRPILAEAELQGGPESRECLGEENTGSGEGSAKALRWGHAGGGRGPARGPARRPEWPEHSGRGTRGGLTRDGGGWI